MALNPYAHDQIPVKIMHKPIFVTLLFLCCCAGAVCENFDDAYTVITPAQTAPATGEIMVLEIFWYGCPHCYDFEPYLRQWLKNKPANVTFLLMPGILNNTWVPHAKAFYTAEKLGILEKIHQPLFDAIHKDQLNIYTDDAIREFFIGFGVDGEEFSAIYNSKEVWEKILQAHKLQQNIRITGVPSVIINGKYLSSPSMARSYDNMLKVMDYLVDKEGGKSLKP